jgi:hypothetical protein
MCLSVRWIASDGLEDEFDSLLGLALLEVDDASHMEGAGMLWVGFECCFVVPCGLFQVTSLMGYEAFIEEDLGGHAGVIA